MNNKLFFLILFFSLFTTKAIAEGSRELMTNGGYRPYLTYSDEDTVDILEQPKIRVFVNQGEQIHLGSSVYYNTDDPTNTQDIVYRSPSKTQTGNCDVQATGYGFIDTITKETAGPLPNTQGYTPCSFIAQETGIYEIEFHSISLSAGGPRMKPVTRAFPVNNDQGSQIAAWDVTVFKTPDEATTEQKGRVYANFLPLHMGGRRAELNSIFYILSNTGHLYRVNLNGIKPMDFMLFTNNKGFKNASDEFGQSLFRSVDLSDVGKTVFLHRPNEPDTITDITHKIFFNPPDDDLPLDELVPLPDGTTWLRSTPPPQPEVTNFQFTGNEGTLGQAGTAPLGGSFTFNTNVDGNYILTLDINGNGIYGDGNDRRFLGQATAAGLNTITWDSLDGQGNTLPALDLPYGAKIGLMDDVHFPVLDAEENPNGFIFEKINCDTSPCTLQDNKVYYDNSLFADSDGIPPNPLSATDGIDSSGGIQSFSDDFGDRKAIDTWTMLAPPVELPGGVILKQADLTISKTHSTTPPPVSGGPITYTIIVKNNGPSHVAGIKVQDNLPASIINSFWICEVSTSTIPPPAIQNHCGNSLVNGAIDTTVDLQVGATATFTVTADINANEGDTVTNTVTLTRPNDVTNPQGTQADVKTETAQDTFTLAPPANQPPVAKDKTATTPNDTTVQLPPLAATDTDGNITNYNLLNLTASTQGLLYLGDPATGGTLVTEGQSLTAADISNLYFQPNTSFTGKASFNYKATDNQGATSESAMVTITVTPAPTNQPPVAENLMANSTPNDKLVQLPTLSATDTDGTIAAYTIATFPPANQGILYLKNPNNGGVPMTAGQSLALNEIANLFFQPNNNFTGNANFTYTATDNNGTDSNIATVTIPITAPNQPPIAQDKTAPTTQNNITVAIPTLVATDADGTIASYQIKSLPTNSEGVVYLGNPDHGGQPLSINKTLTSSQIENLFFQPNKNFSGETQFTYSATDDQGDVSNTATVTLPVTTPPNDPPIANNDSANTDPGVPITIDILKNDSDPNDNLNPSSVTITTSPPNGNVIVNADGSVTYTPKASFTLGTDIFIYQICDNSVPPLCDTTEVTVTVPSQQPPVADNKTAAATLNNTTVPIPTLSATDDGMVVSYTIKTLPSANQGILYLGDPTDGGQPLIEGQSLTPAQVNQLFFQPNPSFVGDANFTYTATDDLDAISSPALVKIPITAPVNQRPIANDNSASTDPETPVIIAILDDDSDPEGQLNPTSLTITTPPPNGQVTINADSTVTYTPNSELLQATDLFIYEVCDSGLPPQCDTAVVTVTVPTSGNQPPVADKKTASATPNNVTTSLPTLSATDSDGTVVSYTIASLPPENQGTLYLGAPIEGGTLITQGQVLTLTEITKLFFQPNENFTGTASFTYTATDEQDAISNTALVSIPVTATEANQPPIANDETTDTDPLTPVTISILGNDTDPEGQLDFASLTITTLPTKGKVTINSDGTVTYTPQAGFTTGSDTFSYELCDLGSPIECDSAQVTVTVPQSGNQPPIAAFIVADVTPNDSMVQLPALSATDADGTVVSYTVTTLPLANQGVLYLSNPTSSGTPMTANQMLTLEQISQLFFQPNTSFKGEASFTYTATDNQAAVSSPALVAIPIIMPTNNPPTANSETATTQAQTPVTIAILSNDTDPDSSLNTQKISILTPPPNGNIIINRDGTITYTPNANFATGTDILTYQVCDSGVPPQCDTAIVTITVTPLTNYPPIANNDTTSTDPETPVLIAILNNDSDPEEQLNSASITITQPPIQGQVAISATGTVTYTPNPGVTTGIDNFTYQVCDNGTPALCDTAIVTVTVPIPTNMPPVADNKTAPSISNDTIVQLPQLSATDTDTIISYTIKTLPPINQGILYLGDPTNGGVPVTAGQVLTPKQMADLFFEPNPDFTGNASFTYTATDDQGGESSPALVTIPVTGTTDSVNLIVKVLGEGQVTSLPTGLNCQSSQTCTQSLTIDTAVTLLPTAATNWTFEGWRGHCDETGRVLMTGNKQCTAIFAQTILPQVTLNVARKGVGTVTSEPTGIVCGDDCSEAFANGTQVTLTATHQPGHAFTGWSGDCSGQTTTITVTAGQVARCQANFAPDDDGDGVANDIEDAAPNGGDGNNDGIPDSQQNNVVSLPGTDGLYLTVEEQNGCQINKIELNSDSLPSDGDNYYPALLDYDLACDEAKIKVYYHGIDDLTDSSQRQYAFTTPGDANTGQWQEQAADSRGTTIIDGQPVATETFTLTDGKLGDNTATDGRIIHISGRNIVPGQLQLSPTTLTVDEFGNIATFAVKRLNGCEGRITVDYSTLAETATPVDDYQPIAGTLSWADGDCSNKTITVPINDDDLTEENETFTLNLSNPTGGVTLATPNRATITITDNETSTSSPTSCYDTSTCQVCCTGCESVNSELKVKSLSMVLEVGETETVILADGEGELLIKEIPNHTFVSLDSWQPLNMGAGEITLTGVSVGETKMVISDSAAPLQTLTLYITVRDNQNPSNSENNQQGSFRIKAIQADLAVGQQLEMTVAGGEGELAINDIPNPNIVLLKAWTPLADTGTAEFILTGVSTGTTKMIITDQSSPAQKITVYITVTGNQNSLPNDTNDPDCQAAIGVDSQLNPVNTTACFMNHLKLNESRQRNHSRFTHSEAQTLAITAEVKIDPAHVGKTADILMVAVYSRVTDATLYTRDEQHWQSWDGQISRLPSTQYYPQLPEQIEIFVFEGDLSFAPGEITVYVGYQLHDGTIIYNGTEPLHFVIGNSASYDPQRDPSTEINEIQATSIFQPYVYNHEGQLGNARIFDWQDGLGVSTFVQVEPRHVGQSADILIVAEYFGTLTTFSAMRMGPKWEFWDRRPISLAPAQHYHKLPESLEIPIYIGKLTDVPGYFRVYVGYRLLDGVIVYNGVTPIQLTVANGIHLTAQGEQRPTTARFLSFVHQNEQYGNPFTTTVGQPIGFATDLWIDPAHLGQTADIRMVAIRQPLDSTTPAPLWGNWEPSSVVAQMTLPNVILESRFPNLRPFENNAFHQIPGQYIIYIGYQLKNGDIIYNGGELLQVEVLF
jgi:hypothetical protein